MANNFLMEDFLSHKDKQITPETNLLENSLPSNSYLNSSQGISMKSHKSIRLKKEFLMDRLVKNAVRRRQHDVESVLKLQKISSLNSANA